MSNVDPLVALLSGLDRPVDPRPEFREALLSRLLDELRPAARDWPRGERRSWRSWVSLRVPWRFRVALVVVAALLVLAGLATATYLGVRTWVSAGSGGVQYQSGYRLATVFDGRGQGAVGNWTGVALDPRGHDLYALDWPHSASTPELVRIRGVDRRAHLRAIRVLDLGRLGGLRLHGGAGLVPLPEKPSECCAPQELATAPNGDLFLLAARRESLNLQDVRYGDIALFVLHRDGTRQRVIGLGDLLKRKVLAPARRGIALGVVASASNRLWLRADSFGRGDSYHFDLLEVVDPNGDGDWQDRVVRRIVLPPVIAAAAARPTWVQLAAEPPLPGDDRSGSVLLTVDGRIYRIADENGDGDALDRGEVRLLLERHGGGSAIVAPRVVRGQGRVRRELVTGGLTQLDRVSLISAGGAVTDIARAFPWGSVQGVLAGPRGAIYVVSCCWTVYRLEPSSRGPRAGRTGTPVSSLPPPPPAAAPASAGSQIVVTTSRGAFTVGADGRHQRLLAHGAADCFSVDRSQMAYTSEAETPSETFVYLAGANGSRPRKIAEAGAPLCPFSSRWLVLVASGLARLDLLSGQEVEIAQDVGVDALSPDGSRLVYTDRQERMMLVDLATLARRRLAAAPAGTSFAILGSGPMWSPDGSRIAYLTGPPWLGGAQAVHRRYSYVLWVRDAGSGAVVVRAPFVGRGPSVSWSPDSTRLLLCVKVRGGGFPSCGGVAAKRSPYTMPPARLLLLTLPDRSLRVLARGRLVFAGWAPSGGAMAYATPDALYIRTVDGATREVAREPGGRWPVGGAWFGWSPDGRYVGAVVYGRALISVDVETGRVPVIKTHGAAWLGASWWRR